MPRHDQIENAELRELLERAFQSLRERDSTQSVRLLVSCFLRAIELEPRVLRRSVSRPNGREIPAVAMWPSLGANLDLASLRAGKPSVEFVRESFSSSEAMTYYEFVVETLLAAQK